MVQLTLAIGHKIGASLLVIEHKIGVLSFGLDTKAVDSLSFGLDTKAIDSLVLVSDTKFTGGSKCFKKIYKSKNKIK